ncbi:MAG: dienelactone hydrolase family protein, partial [Caulobacteraceae bacterium]
GVNAVMREVCDQLASDCGYLAICPDLFWRLEPGVELTDKTKAQWDAALGYMNRFDADKGIEDIQAAIDFVRARPDCNGKVGDVGYCLGGRLAFMAAARTSTDASVSYYGVGLDGLLGEADAIRSPLMLHIAGEDGFSSHAARDKVVEALKDYPQVMIHVYDGQDHAFARPGGEHFNREAAGLANGRTAAFFKEHLG